MNRSNVGSSTVLAAVFALLAAFILTIDHGGLRAAETAGQQGAALYKSKCAMCHGAEGSGNTPIGKAMKLPDLRSSEVQKQSNAQLAAVISKGKGKMPASNGLSEAQINQLVAFVRNLAKRK